MSSAQDATANPSPGEDPKVIYYLREGWLKGPVSMEEIGSLLDAGVLDETTALWTPARESWMAPAGLMASSGDTARLPARLFADAAARAAAGNAGGPAREAPDWSRLPTPKSLLALRLVREQHLITTAQADRVLKEMFKNPDPKFEFLMSLQLNGWITAGQRATLEAIINRDSVPTLIAGYEILKELGCGGFGTTYLARQLSLDRDVALKVLLPRLSQDAEYIRRFQHEAKMAARLNHENNATAYDVGEVGGKHYITMEYVEGRTLADLLEDKSRFPEREAVDIVIQVCRALAHADEHGLVHRDIKPENIIVKPNGQVKLIDLGLAKATASGESSVTATGFLVCTPDYTSPEQALGQRDIDIRSDIYSLGCVLYEMLTGEKPFPNMTQMAKINMHIDQPLPLVRALRPDASDCITSLVERMTAKRPEDRQQTPGEVIEDLVSGAGWSAAVAVARTAIRPVSEQLEAWGEDGRVEIRLLPDWREYVHLISLRLDERLEKAKADPEFHGYVQTVFAELVANAFDHGCKDAAEGIVKLRMELNDAFFSLEVKDPGLGFDWKETLERVKKEPIQRHRRRGLMQVDSIADVFAYVPPGNHVKAVLYRKKEGSGISAYELDGITFVAVKGRGDLALVEAFRRWVRGYDAATPRRVCLMVHVAWASSLFVGTIIELEGKLTEAASALAVWVEHESCYNNMKMLGITEFIPTFTQYEEAVRALHRAEVKTDVLPLPNGEGPRR